MARHKEYYKGEGGGFPQVRVVLSLMSLCLFVAWTKKRTLTFYAFIVFIFGLIVKSIKEFNVRYLLWVLFCTP
jgi:hypothetical protein